MRALVICDTNGSLPVTASFDSPTDGDMVFVLTGTDANRQRARSDRHQSQSRRHGHRQRGDVLGKSKR